MIHLAPFLPLVVAAFLLLCKPLDIKYSQIVTILFTVASVLIATFTHIPYVLPIVISFLVSEVVAHGIIGLRGKNTNMAFVAILLPFVAVFPWYLGYWVALYGIVCIAVIYGLSYGYKTGRLTYTYPYIAAAILSLASCFLILIYV